MRWTWRTRTTWGHTALGIWLIATGLVPLLGIDVPHAGQILAALAVLSGILILIQR
jgi:hypothetical protein